MIDFIERKKIELIDLYQKNKLHHAIIISGDSSIEEKLSFANSLALQAMSVENNSNSFNPNLLIISKEESKKNIAVDQIREILNFTNQSSFSSSSKFIIINAIDDLNKSSSNALLKVLEEPKKNNFFLLISSSISQILPTIKSRCQIIKISGANFEEFRNSIIDSRPKFLPKIDEKELKFLSKICENSASLATKYGDEITECYQAFLESLKNGFLNENIVKKISDKNFDFNIFLRIATFFLYRLNLSNINFLEEFFFDEEIIFAKISNNFSKKEILNMAQDLVNIESKIISLNLDKKLFLINFFNSFINFK